MNALLLDRFLKRGANPLVRQAIVDTEAYADLLLAEGGTDIRANGEFSKIVEFVVGLYIDLGRRSDFWMFRSSQNMGTGSIAYSFHGEAATLIGSSTWGSNAISVPSSYAVTGIRAPNTLITPLRYFKTQIFVGKRNASENINYSIQILDSDTNTRRYVAIQFLFENNVLQGAWPMGKSLYYDNSVDPNSPNYYQDYGVLQIGGTATFTDRGSLLPPRPITDQAFPTNYSPITPWLASNWGKPGNASFGLLFEGEIDGAIYSQIIQKYRATIGRNLPWYV